MSYVPCTDSKGEVFREIIAALTLLQPGTLLLMRLHIYSYVHSPRAHDQRIGLFEEEIFDCSLLNGSTVGEDRKNSDCDQIRR